MDFKVYKKEDVRQPSGDSFLIVPDVIDIVPVTEDDSIVNFELVEDENETEQQCSLSVIWQKGLDPLALTDGISWSQAILGETNIIQIMEELLSAVENVTTKVTVDFGTTTTAEGVELFTFTLKGAN